MPCGEFDTPPKSFSKKVIHSQWCSGQRIISWSIGLAEEG